MKPQKPLSINSSPEKIVKRIKELELQLSQAKAKGFTPSHHYEINEIKQKLNELFLLRKEQKNFKPIPTKIKKKGF